MSAYGFALRSVSERSVSSGPLFRLGLATLLFLLLPVAAGAYTLVLRSGRHVTIPDDFRLTPTAVTYEAAPGFTVTVWLSNVDFAATEKANAEPAGSFAGRIKRETEAAAAAPATGAVQTGRRAGPRVVTNRELEPSRLRREAQEEEYERTRRERGMPSREELRERFAEQERRLRERARQLEAERAEAELESLRSEVVNVRRQLNQLSIQLSRPAAGYALPDYYPYLYSPPSQVITVLPFRHHSRFGRGGFGPHPHARRWPHNPPPGYPSPTHVSPSRNAGAMPSAMSAPRR
jgi:hypothetical protein